MGVCSWCGETGHQLAECPDLLSVGSGPYDNFFVPPVDLGDLVFSPDSNTPKPAKKPPDDRYPHRCPRCGAPAFIGFNQVDCSKRCS